MNAAHEDSLVETKSIKGRLSFMDKIRAFPGMPANIFPLMVKINTPYPHVRDVEKSINLDPALVSYILKLTNSALFNLTEEVRSVLRAIVLIGMPNLRLLVSSYFLRILCKTITHKDVQKYLWNHSLSAAVFSRVIAQKVYGKNHPNAYVSGLLHDIGKFVLYMHSARDFQESLERGIINDVDFVSAEKQIFGFSHIETGYLMVDKLGFSKPMKDIILFHHDPEYGPADNKMQWVVSFSNELAHNIYDNKSIGLDKFLRQINVPKNEFVGVFQVARKHLEYFRKLV